MLTAAGIRVFRFLGGVSALILGVVLLAGHHGEEALSVALIALGSFLLFHMVVEYVYHAIVDNYGDSRRRRTA